MVVMSKLPYFIIPVLTTTVISAIILMPAIISFVKINGCTDLAISLGLGLGIGLIVDIIYACICNVSRYIPSVDVYYSTNGKNFSSNIYAIPLRENFYLKFVISIKAHGILWKLYNPVISCDISYPEAWTLNHLDNDYNCKCMLHGCLKENEKGKRNRGICGNATATFKIVASDRPKKTEIILKVTREKVTNREPVFSINYSKQVNNAYSLIIKPGFVDSHGRIC
jgi:hypothetical protein